MFSFFSQIMIVLWTIFLLGMMSIGGYFMFRKFLKRLPKEDGKSILDWQEEYLQKTRHLWSTEQKELLEELVKPVPSLFRDIARDKIAGKIGELALLNNAPQITQGLIIEGYIKATPKRDHAFLIKTLKKKEIDFTEFKHLLAK
ncbi:DUF2621 family protein [Bacillus sp. AFS055030]|uniref:DUF2621 family protein n=1 Tax=Bacillus sp. AFS055030 TaxID=2033507 RepID=UPI000BFC54F4|nr:DUF2621 family protein [Bacillus sp. AFS055030]PGL68826.1 hypothetical protein CN925_17295 [Bacillus sp. AFS055030]